MTFAAAMCAAVGVAPHAAGAASCPSGKSVILKSASAVLYETDEVVGCYRKTGRRTFLSSIDGYTYIDPPFRLAGRFLGAQRTHCTRDSDSCPVELAVWDLATARPPWVISGVPTDVELKSNGSFAAIVEAEKSRVRRVFVFDAARQEDVLIERGFDIDPHSLSREGRNVRWTRNGVVRRARLR